MIQLKDVLHRLEKPSRDRQGQPVPVQIEFVTCDEKKGTGGELVSLDGVVLAKLTTSAAPKVGRPTSEFFGKRANEWHNGTRNFYHVVSQQVRKVHIRLITQFNYATVVY
ncbi:MAG: hypothetical protein ACRYFZ_16080 [Janthinobacterium lividum]